MPEQSSTVYCRPGVGLDGRVMVGEITPPLTQAWYWFESVDDPPPKFVVL